MAEVNNNKRNEIQLVSNSVLKKRLNICKECIHYMKRTEQCDICLCIMPAKASNADASCPIHKWESL